MAEETRRNPPFHLMTFTLVQNGTGRKLIRLKEVEDGYEVHVEKGSAANPELKFTRTVPVETAQRLKDAFDSIGVFSWNELYGDTSEPGSLRWSLNTVFKEGVFSVASKGGSDTPRGFNDMLEEFYRLDFPRPAAPEQAPLGATAGLNAEAQAAGASAGTDFSWLSSALPPEMLEELSHMTSKDVMELMDEFRRDPQAMQRQMKEEFRQLSPEDQNAFIDALAQTGLASREFWEQFFRGL